MEKIVKIACIVLAVIAGVILLAAIVLLVCRAVNANPLRQRH